MGPRNKVLIQMIAEVNRPKPAALSPFARIIFCGTLILLVAAAQAARESPEPGTTNSQAQTPARADGFPSENTLQSWLAGGDPRLVAWGAHDALVTRDRNLIPNLLTLAARGKSPPNEDSGAGLFLSAQVR